MSMTDEEGGVRRDGKVGRKKGKAWGLRGGGRVGRKGGIRDSGEVEGGLMYEWGWKGGYQDYTS